MPLGLSLPRSGNDSAWPAEGKARDCRVLQIVAAKPSDIEGLLRERPICAELEAPCEMRFHADFYQCPGPSISLRQTERGSGLGPREWPGVFLFHALTRLRSFRLASSQNQSSARWHSSRSWIPGVLRVA